MTLDINDDAYVGHKPCPKCGSKDNVYRYPDGHEFCFGRCGYVKQAPLTKDVICALLKEKEDHEAKAVDRIWSIPAYAEDATETLADPGLTWIKKYGIWNDEIQEHGILWSKSQEQLIFPIYENAYACDVIAWQARNFKPNSRKYLTFGKIDEILHILGLTKHTNSDIIIVEDMVSAIKVSRHFRCMPLFGSGCSRAKLTRLRRYSECLKFWLDADKFGTSMKMAKVAAQLGFKTSVIHTEKDPKEHTNEQIFHLGKT